MQVAQVNVPQNSVIEGKSLMSGLLANARNLLGVPSGSGQPGQIDIKKPGRRLRAANANFERLLAAKQGDLMTTDILTCPLYVTQKFCRDIMGIYGKFTSKDDEYPAMGITIQGAPIFVECVRFPDCSVTRRAATDAVQREHPEVGALWEQKLHEYRGKCRTSTVHIHPMNFPNLSGTDVMNFDSLRRDPADPSTFDGELPFPVILVNLKTEPMGKRRLQLLGFWVMDGKSYRVSVIKVDDDDSRVALAWELAQPVPFFSEERNMTLAAQERADEWKVELLLNTATGEKAMRATKDDQTAIVPFYDLLTTKENRIRFERYVDWSALFKDMAEQTELAAE